LFCIILGDDVTRTSGYLGDMDLGDSMAVGRGGGRLSLPQSGPLGPHSGGTCAGRFAGLMNSCLAGLEKPTSPDICSTSFCWSRTGDSCWFQGLTVWFLSRACSWLVAVAYTTSCRLAAGVWAPEASASALPAAGTVESWSGYKWAFLPWDGGCCSGGGVAS